MELDKNQLIKIYVTRLVNSLVPSEFGQEYIQSLNSTVLNTLITHNNRDKIVKDYVYQINKITEIIKNRFIEKGKFNEFKEFSKILERLAVIKDVSQIYNYLVFFLKLEQNSNLKSEVGFQNQKKNYYNFSLNEDNKQNHNNLYTGHNNQIQNEINNQNFFYGGIKPKTGDYGFFSDILTLEKQMMPYYKTLDEKILLDHISYTLLGLDSKIISFSNTKYIKIPNGINNSYLNILFTIFECSLLYKNSKVFIEQNIGKLRSPVKTAFLTSLEVYLNEYVLFINNLFKSRPSSLLFINNKIFFWILKFRVLYNLINSLTVHDGYNFLSKIYELSKFGDNLIKSLNEKIFFEISAPYYEILEHWIINGELIDNSNEFFIKFNQNQNDISDIIEFIPSKIPLFLDKSLGYKIYQIGKILIFLLKYCKELELINEYRTKYSKIIFNHNKGLQSMSNNLFFKIINQQYEEIINYFTFVIHGSKNKLFEQLVNLKKVYFLQNNDFIEILISKGFTLFNDSSSNISLNYLSNIIKDSINLSSVKSTTYGSRLDARIFDSDRGSIGWDVFTLDLKISDLPVNYILKNEKDKYLKMFSFLWNLRVLKHLLNDNFIDFCNLKKSEMNKIIHQEIKKNNQLLEKFNTVKKKSWVYKSFNLINIARINFVKFIDSLVYYFSFDIIEFNFNEMIFKRIFIDNNVEIDDKITDELDNVFYEKKSFNILNGINPNFIKDLKEKNNDNHPYLNQKKIYVVHNINELTFDEIIDIHKLYLDKLINTKLFNVKEIGKTSGKSFNEQIYSIIDVIFEFIKISNEFKNLLINHTLILNIDENNPDQSNSFPNDSKYHEKLKEEIKTINAKVKTITMEIYNILFLTKFKNLLNVFINDLKLNFELKNLIYFF